jgi:hypothetical protein
MLKFCVFGAGARPEGTPAVDTVLALVQERGRASGLYTPIAQGNSSYWGKASVI